MADALQLTDDDFTIDSDAPPGFRSAAGRTNLFVVVFVAAFVLLVIQFIVPQFLVATMMPTGTPTLFNFKIEEIQVAQSVWWQDRLWVTVNSVSPGSPPTTTLRTIDDKGEWVRELDLNLGVPFDHALVDGERLFLVSTSTVSTVQDRQVRTTYPRIKLNQPSAPFVARGQLSILDHPAGQPDVVWYDYQEGEWVERGRIPMPGDYQTAVAARPATTITTRGVRLRVGAATPMTVVVSGGNDNPLAVVLPDGRVWVAVALIESETRLWSTIDPVLTKAATDEDEEDRPADGLVLDDPTTFVVWSEQSAPYCESFAVALLNGDPVLINLPATETPTPFSSTRLQVLAKRGSEFVSIHESPTLAIDRPVPLTKPDGTLVFVAAAPLSPMGMSVIELTKDGFGPVRRLGDAAIMNTSKPGFWLNYLLMYLVPIATSSVLGLIAHIMVERHRDRRFSFGHHTVKLASVARRGVARVVDMFLFSLPMTITAAVVFLTMDVMAEVENLFNSGAFTTMIFWGFVFVLGMMLYTITVVLIFGTLEGIWGLSPGKWLVGIRVVRTTFQPIGFFRGLIRQFLLMIDGQFNYFVAILMAACMPKSQRLGDLCADSIVVEKTSLPPNWPRQPTAPVA